MAQKKIYIKLFTRRRDGGSIVSAEAPHLRFGATVTSILVTSPGVCDITTRRN